MPAEFLWTIPTRAPRRQPWPPGVTDTRPSFDLFDDAVAVARAAEATGFAGVVIPYDPTGDDAWVIAPVLARETPRLLVIPEFQPGFATAVYTAKLALSFQRFFANRLGWKLALDTSAELQRKVGDFVEHSARVARADELLTVTRGVWDEGPFDFVGAHFEAQGSGFFEGNAATRSLHGYDLPRRPHPRVYLEGATEAEFDLSARHADVHLFPTAEPANLARWTDDLRRRAGYRPIDVGVRVRVLVRDTDEEARRDVARSLGPTPDISGGHERVADALRALVDAGATTFLLDSAVPLDAYVVGERVLPLLEGVLA